MKHLKTFESFSPNTDLVDEGIKRFFTGYDSKEEMESKKLEILNKIDQLESESKRTGKLHTWVYKNGRWQSSGSFIKSDLIEPAEKNNWKGTVSRSKSDKKGISYVGYNDGKTPLHSMFSGGGGFMQ